MVEFKEFPKIPRLHRLCVITEKIDGTNASVTITEDGQFLTGSKSKWITPEEDNYGFSKWANSNKEELMKLGIGTHHGEWCGLGIQRNYGFKEKRWYLFNTSKWKDDSVRPKCCYVVPIIYEGLFNTEEVNFALDMLKREGSIISPEFKAEGVIIFLLSSNSYFKQTIEKDDGWKGKQ